MGVVDPYLVPAIDGVAYGLLLFVVAAGLTLSFGVGSVLNLAHGTLYAIGAYVAAALGDGTWSALLLAVAVGTVAGAASGGVLAAAVAPLAHRGHLAQALLTFGVALIAGALLVHFFGPDPLRPVIPSVIDVPITILGHRYPGYRLAFIGVAILLAVGGWVALTRTRLGMLVRATVDDPQMIAAGGVNPRMVQGGVMVVAGALAGLAGVLGAPIIGPGPGTAETVLLLSLVIVVVGGLGSITGALAAAVAVGQVQSLGVVIAPSAAPWLLFTAMAIALIMRRPHIGSGGVAH